MSAIGRTTWHAQPVDAHESSFHVTYVAPSGFKYEVTGWARSEVEAVTLADEMLEYVERIGISDHLESDGISARPPAQLHVKRIQSDEARAGPASSSQLRMER